MRVVEACDVYIITTKVCALNVSLKFAFDNYFFIKIVWKLSHL